MSRKIALMRFGLGPKLGTPPQTANGRDACLQELNNPSAALLPDSSVSLRGKSLTLAYCADAGLNGLGNAMTPMKQLTTDILDAEIRARIIKQNEPRVGFVERLVLFWSNHFNIDCMKNEFVRATIGNFERNAIRPHVLGKFSDMLKAVYQHPCMLSYLDNTYSIGPNSVYATTKYDGLTGHPKAERKMYNENLARECMELHTLGIVGRDNSGNYKSDENGNPLPAYTQDDVIALAKVLTGWTFASDSKYGPTSPATGLFGFQPNYHEPGAHMIRGKTYYDAGQQQGLDVLDDLASDTATAYHIATKLVTHFIANNPLPDEIDTIANVFRSTDGDLKAVAIALLNLPRATNDMTRIRLPYVWMVSVFRGALVDKGAVLAAKLFRNINQDGGQLYSYDIFIKYARNMSHGIWRRVTPDGYPDDQYFWMTPDAVKLRKDMAPGFMTYIDKQWTTESARALPDQLLPDEMIVANRTIEFPGVDPSTKAQIEYILGQGTNLAYLPQFAAAFFFASPDYLLG